MIIDTLVYEGRHLPNRSKLDSAEEMHELRNDNVPNDVVVYRIAPDTELYKYCYNNRGNFPVLQNSFLNAQPNDNILYDYTTHTPNIVANAVCLCYNEALRHNENDLLHDDDIQMCYSFRPVLSYNHCSIIYHCCPGDSGWSGSPLIDIKTGKLLGVFTTVYGDQRDRDEDEEFVNLGSRFGPFQPDIDGKWKLTHTEYRPFKTGLCSVHQSFICIIPGNGYLCRTPTCLFKTLQSHEKRHLSQISPSSGLA